MRKNINILDTVLHNAVNSYEAEPDSSVRCSHYTVVVVRNENSGVFPDSRMRVSCTLHLIPHSTELHATLPLCTVQAIDQAAQLWQRDRASSAILTGWVLKGYVSRQYL